MTSTSNPPPSSGPSVAVEMQTTNSTAAEPLPSSHNLPVVHADTIDDNFSSASSSSSSSSSYKDPSDNDLSLISGSALIMADCVGTGILALPHDVRVLGKFIGLGFIILNLPINLYAGTILGKSASFVEHDNTDTHHHHHHHHDLMMVNAKSDHHHHDIGEDDQHDGKRQVGKAAGRKGRKYEAIGKPREVIVVKRRSESSEQLQERTSPGGYSSIDATVARTPETSPPSMITNVDAEDPAVVKDGKGEDALEGTDAHHHHHYHNQRDVHTFDFIGMTSYLFTTTRRPTQTVTTIYYTNIFLVLGNYILVMSHAVAAIFGEENICLPTAGIVASTLMFALSQLRTMANLGRSASVISLTALVIVVVQCLYAVWEGEVGYDQEEEQQAEDAANEEEAESTSYSLMSQLAAISSIGFAVGSQKLFLNIRHEMKDRNDAAPGSLGIALSIFGSAYVAVCVLAGPDPPSLLFDAIEEGLSRRIAGFLLWVHVAVSFAINSQALCSSLDRLYFHRITQFGLNTRHRTRWMCITMIVAVSSYFVANAVPFFKDLVALIGALTSVPLTLLMPAVFYRKVCQVPIFKPTRYSMTSYCLVVFSIVFLVCGLIGALGSIELDWEHHGPPFACRK